MAAVHTPPVQTLIDELAAYRHQAKVAQRIAFHLPGLRLMRIDWLTPSAGKGASAVLRALLQCCGVVAMPHLYR